MLKVKLDSRLAWVVFCSVGHSLGPWGRKVDPRHWLRSVRGDIVQKISCNVLDQVKMTPCRYMFSQNPLLPWVRCEAWCASFEWMLDLFMAPWREMPNNLSAWMNDDNATLVEDVACKIDGKPLNNKVKLLFKIWASPLFDPYRPNNPKMRLALSNGEILLSNRWISMTLFF